jgi:CBS domain-containing protein
MQTGIKMRGNMDNNETFERLYNELEDLLRRKYKLDATGSGVYQHEFHVGGQTAKNLRAIRELRNYMVHSRMPGAMDPCMATEEAVRFLEKMINAVQQPTRAIDCCIPREKILFASLSTLAIPLMQMMLDRGISHVPVLTENGTTFGVFSGNTLMSEIVAIKAILIDSKTVLRDFAKLLPIHVHVNERYVFIAKTAPLEEIIALFGERPLEGKKLRMLFVTENGKETEKILGLITPWDILDDDVVAA